MKKEILFLISLILIIGCNQEKPKILVGDETLEVKILTLDGSSLSKIEVDLLREKQYKKGPSNVGITVANENELLRLIFQKENI